MSSLRKVVSPSHVLVCIHGTHLKHWDSIIAHGICLGHGKTHIRFAASPPDNLGRIVGLKHQCEILIFLDVANAMQDGFEFFCKGEQILCTGGAQQAIPPRYFQTVVFAQPGPTPIKTLTTKQSFDFFVVLDFEATCDRPQIEPMEIIEFPSVLVDGTSGQIVDEFRTYVKPQVHPKLSDFCTQLTGITQSTVDTAPIFQEALQQYTQWLHKHHLISGRRSFAFVTLGDSDFGSMLPTQCTCAGIEIPSCMRSWVNLQIPFKQIMRMKQSRTRVGMKTMLSRLNLVFQGQQHSGLDDCKNTAIILFELLARGAVIKETTRPQS